MITISKTSTKPSTGPRISVTSKLDGIRSWSLEALTTCPGSRTVGGDLVPACSGCYATSGHYRYPNVKAPRLHNQEDWQRPEWVSEMVQALQNDRFFRWLDSGDLYSVKLAEKVFQVMQQTPWCMHWLPTRMQKFDKWHPALDRMRKLPNVSVRFSSDSITGGFTAGVHGSTITASADPQDVPAGATLCEAYSRGGKCNGCRACWDKSIHVIAYPAHGRKMQKVIRLQKVQA
jgi:Gene product 88